MLDASIWTSFTTNRTNVALYPKWQAFLREREPKTIIFWAQDDIFFTREEEKLICRIWPKPRFIDLKPGTSPSRIASTTFQKTCVASTGIGLHPKPSVSIPALHAICAGVCNELLE